MIIIHDKGGFITSKSDLFGGLDDIIFAEKDPALIESDIINLYENITGRTLHRADPVRLFLESIILIIIQQRNLIDFSAKQNLLAYSSGSYLDHLGALLGVTRLDATASVCTVQFEMASVKNFNVIIPKGTRLSAGSLIFATTENCEITAGELIAAVTAQCQDTGSIGNNLVPGQINKLVDVLPYDLSVKNISETNGGSDIESDENFRERIQIAPESFSNAGSKKGYEYYARSAHKNIIACEVLTPPDTRPGYVEIYPLMTGGEIPSDEIIASVYEACNGESVRPDTDFLSVKKPVKVHYNVDLRYWIDKKNSASSSIIQARVNQAVKEFIKWQRADLGRDINPSELNYKVIAAGAKRCEIFEPSFSVLRKFELAVCDDDNVIYSGLEEG